MDRNDAGILAAKVGASFPSSRVSQDTMAEWTNELVKLDYERGRLVVEWIRTNLDAAPTFKQIRLAMARTRPTAAASDPAYTTPGLNDPCEFCQQPVANGPDSASRYDAEFDRWFNAHLSCADARSHAQGREGVAS